MSRSKSKSTKRRDARAKAAAAFSEKFFALLERVAFLRESVFNHTFQTEVERVHLDPYRPRRPVDEDGLQRLARAMAIQGQLYPIIVRDHPERRHEYIIVTGERRWQAAALNGWSVVLAIRHDGEANKAFLIENLTRCPTSPPVLARALQAIIDVEGWSLEDAAEHIGVRPTRIADLLRILELPAEFLEGPGAELPEDVLTLVAGLNRSEQDAVIARVLADPASVYSIYRTCLV